MKRARLVFIKLGGGLITDKERAGSVRLDVIKSLAKEIQQLNHKYPNIKLIIANGAGSFGHHGVKKYGLEKDLKSDKQLFGAAVVQHSVRELHNHLIKQLLAVGLKVFSISPASMLVRETGTDKTSFIEPVKLLLNKGLIPALYGDLVLDRQKGISIASTEQIFAALIKKLKTDYKIQVIFITSVPGVLNSEGRLIEIIDSDKLASVDFKKHKVKGADVTGGMATKLAAALDLARQGIPIYIMGAEKKGNLVNSVEGKSVGTKISGA